MRGQGKVVESFFVKYLVWELLFLVKVGEKVNKIGELRTDKGSRIWEEEVLLERDFFWGHLLF